jgi:predicted SnoaL-like aldol condensation-catalyzing enzyme
LAAFTSSLAGVVDEAVYKQHNPMTPEGGDGLAALFKRLQKMHPKVTFVRVFADGDFAFAHNEYVFNGKPEVVFEVLRFDPASGKAVEHWDNLQPLAEEANASARTMFDGPTEVSTTADTEATRVLVRNYVETVLVGDNVADLPAFVASDLRQHHPDGEDGHTSLVKRLSPNADAAEGSTTPPQVKYDTLHRVLAEGDFALCLCEGDAHGEHSALFDLYRVADGKIAEQWTSVHAIPPRSKWKNQNGKF